MKKLLLASAVGLSLLASTATAEIVKGVGYDKDYDRALARAKLHAVDQFNGSWIVSDKIIKDGEYSESSKEYSGGRIKSYDVVSWDGEKMIIEADVVPQDNTVISNSHKLDQQIKQDLQEALENQKKISSAYKHLQDSKQAFKVIVKESKFIPNGDTVIVHMDIDIVWNPKWLSDSKSLAMTIGKEGETSYGVHNKIVGGITNHMMTNGHPIFAAILGSATWKDEKKQPTGMICYGKTHKSVANECYDTGKNLQFPHVMKIEMKAMGDSKQLFRTVHSVEQSKLYENIAAGTKKHHSSFRSLDMKYLQPTVAIYEKEKYNVKYGFEIDVDRLAAVQEFEFEIQ